MPTMESYANAQILRYAVGRQITCPYSDQVLDVRRAVNVEVKKSDGTTVTDQTMHVDHWDTVKEAVLGLASKGYTVIVLDGRELFRR